jgi:hypothetical protein
MIQTVSVTMDVFSVDVFFTLSLPRLLRDLTVYMSNIWNGCLIRSRNCLPFVSSPPVFFGGVRVAHLFNFCVVLLCVFMFWVPWCGVRYVFGIETMFSSSLPPVVCGRAHVLFRMFSSSLPPIVCGRAHVLFTLFVFVCMWWCPAHIVLCFCFVFLRLVCPMLPVSLDYPFLIATSVFSKVYLNKTIQLRKW